MLSNVKLPKSFWIEAMRTVVDLINLSPSNLLDGDILDRVGKESFGYGDDHIRYRLYDPIDKKVI